MIIQSPDWATTLATSLINSIMRDASQTLETEMETDGRRKGHDHFGTRVMNSYLAQVKI